MTAILFFDRGHYITRLSPVPGRDILDRGRSAAASLSRALSHWPFWAIVGVRSGRGQTPQALASHGASLLGLCAELCAEGQKPCLQAPPKTQVLSLTLPCPEACRLQAPPEQAPAAPASLGDTRRAQVCCGLVYRDGVTFLPARNSTATRRYCDVEVFSMSC